MTEHTRTQASIYSRHAGDLWGGLAAMLVALPSAIAFGVTIFAPLGVGYAAQGALAGILGATALGLVAPLFGGTRRLITAPCAPAAAVLAAFALEMTGNGVTPDKAVLLLALVAAICGGLQFVFGLVGLGRLIKYMPYPVVSGYLSGVGLVIVVSQIPKLLGATTDGGLVALLSDPSGWAHQSIIVGLTTMAVMVIAPRVTRVVPAAILALAFGVAIYFQLATRDASLLELAGNPFIIGPLGSDGNFADAVTMRWANAATLTIADVQRVLIPAVTLAVLLSIDTLKTCVVLDALTRSRHQSNRELIGQGLANIASTAIGGVPGAGQMGATLVNMSSGGQTRLSGVVEGVLSMIAFVALAGFVAWVPTAALAGILIVIGLKMIDWRSVKFLRQRSTVLDFVIIVAVIVVAKTASLIAASGVGVALAVVLFVREKIGGRVVRSQCTGDGLFSKQIRGEREMQTLVKNGSQTGIIELQGSLFFGTADQLYTVLAAEIDQRRYLILDLHRVQSVDVTAAHVLEQIEDSLLDRGGMLLYSALPRRLPTGRDMQRYFSEVGLARSTHASRVFHELDGALEWVENQILEQAGFEPRQEMPLLLSEMDLFAGRKPETLGDLSACLQSRTVPAGQRVFACGDETDELCLIRRGKIRIVLPIGDGPGHHLATFGRGAFFGEMAFLDPGPRSADAIASVDTDLYVISRSRFDAFAAGHKRAGLALMRAVARSLAVRLRYTNAEVGTLREG